MPEIPPVNIGVNVGVAKGLRDIGTLNQAIANSARVAARAAKDSSQSVKQSKKEELTVVKQTMGAEMVVIKQHEKSVAEALHRQTRDHDKLEREKTRATERENKARERSYHKTANSIMASIEKQAKREAKAIEAAAHARRQFANNVAGRFTNGVGNSISRVGGLATTALGLMGGFGIADSVHERANMHGKAKDIALSGSKTGGRQFSSKEVLDVGTAEGIRSGQGTEAALEGLDEFNKKTGDLKLGMDMLGKISAFADASGTSLKDMSSASAELFASGTVKNGKELENILGSFIEMGKEGAVEMKDLAKGFAKITATAGIFGGPQDANAKTLTAMAEVAKARGGAAGPINALTSVQAFGSDVMGNAAKLKSNLKVDIRDAKGDMRSSRDILADVVTNSGGREDKLKGLFGRQGIRAVRGSMRTFNEALEKTKDAAHPHGDKDAARAAVIAELLKLEEKQLSLETAQSQATERRMEADRQFATAMEKLKVAVGEQLLPEIIKLIPQLTRLIPAIADIAERGAKLATWFANNPFLGIGALVGAFLLKELTIAFALAKGEALLTGGINGTTTAIAGAGTLGKAGIVAGTVAAAVGAGAAVKGGLETIGLVNSSMDQGYEDMGADIAGAGSASKIFSKGPATLKDIQASKDKLKELQDKQTAAEGTDTGFANKFTAGLGASVEGAASVFGYKGTGARDDASRIIKAEERKNNEGMKVAIEMLKTVIEANTVALQDGGGANRNVPIAQRGGSNGN